MNLTIVGSGQLARMLALSGMPLGLNASFLLDDATTDVSCIDRLGKVVRYSPGIDPYSLYLQLGSPGVITVEKEHLDFALLRELERYATIHPNIKALEQLGDRGEEKKLLDDLDIPTARYFIYQPGQPPTDQELSSVGEKLVIKATKGGYDGKQQQIVNRRADLTEALLAGSFDSCIIEDFVNFEREISIIGARATSGDIVFYPIAENRHDRGILRTTVSPAANISPQQELLLQNYLRQITEAIDYVGVLAIECFIADDEILVNEIAPRVHNSGHWSMNAGLTSQFENHLRAITGMQLGNVEMHGAVGMVNLLGVTSPPKEFLAENAYLHWYGKPARPGRKVGHVNFRCSTSNDARNHVAYFEEILGRHFA